ncbi:MULTISPECIES: hypothetical protein [unclassified Pseudomonas]|uniref:hypothetical protein n=1 Tax=unclassified Pseudomonas TaxID=196821 RepID=UPI002AC89CFB|nr:MULTISPECIES: hypothetical protein [unclassified Pseudomonas]MEB0041459.1 hypothetical protein [Pseudomonas sp. MH10]MEB0121932.1 hypothetical protein [Pseudomonas sp. CCI1.2]WPX64453.1 hypothetical protein RHM59_01785 [Pseudomonas sp. MH10]
MNTNTYLSTHTQALPFIFGGDQSPLNDSDADEDDTYGGYGGDVDIDLEDLRLEEFSDSDKLDSTHGGDVGSSSLS